MEHHTEADCSIQEHPAFCFRTKSIEKPISAYPARSHQFVAALGWIAAFYSSALNVKNYENNHNS